MGEEAAMTPGMESQDVKKRGAAPSLQGDGQGISRGEKNSQETEVSTARCREDVTGKRNSERSWGYDTSKAPWPEARGIRDCQ